MRKIYNNSIMSKTESVIHAKAKELLKLNPTPVRIRLRRKKGWRLQEFSHNLNGLPAISCTLPGKWGNHFRVNKDRNAFQSVEEYEQWLLNTDEGLKIYSEAKRDLRGKNLACGCFGSPCHVADVLLPIANA
jgi:hypothetical protein